ncbi:hypothetical protein SUBVAR_04126 [Subdoligranulum variabile DSM 15176]|uniref:Uncharacterized protein n=1 Tax=Subdoligranulum variabile DSM 15176 TaxID=411471 RepID=D1PIG0_9FIRM|nr:hypothetical protein SUBVAR_04126 [Subdoligranulum variabile DSM 15176]
MPGIAHDTAHFDDTPYFLTTVFPRAAPNKKRQPARPLYRTSCCLEPAVPPILPQPE